MIGVSTAATVLADALGTAVAGDAAPLSEKAVPALLLLSRRKSALSKQASRS
jgi:hypothetical protein